MSKIYSLWFAIIVMIGGFFPVYALTPVYTLNEVSGSLESYLNAIDYGEVATNTWIKPDDEKISQFKLVFSDFIAGNYEAAQKNAIAVGYEIVKYTNTDVGVNDIHYILQEVQTGSFSGGGTFVLFPTGKNAVLQTPHPKFDSNTAKQGIEAYLSIRPRLLMLSGTRRNNSTAKSSCTDGNYFDSDVAHQTQSLFYAAHQIVSDADRTTPFIQFHGFGSSSLTTLQTQCNSTNNKLINISEGVNYVTAENENSLLHILRRKVEAGGIIEACVYGNDTTNLGGTTNVEGRYTNYSSSSCYNKAATSTKRFIHLEQSYNVRADHRADMSNYINEALTEYLAKIAPDVTQNANTLLGVYHGNQGWAMDDVRALETWQEKKHAVITLFTNFNPAYQNNLMTQQLPAIWNNGNIPLISWEPYLQTSTTPSSIEADIAQGDYDAYINSWVADLKVFLSGTDGTFNTDDDRRVYLRFAHEMNGNWYPWSAVNADESPQSYIAMWRRIHDIFTIAGLEDTHVQWIWSVSASDHNNQVYLAEHYYPGDDYVNWLGVDGYNFGASSEDSRWRSPTEVFSNMVARLRLLANKPIAINETAARTQEGVNITEKNAWIEELFTYVHANNIQLLSWFNIDKESDWAIFAGGYGDAIAATGEKVYSAYKTGVQSSWMLSADSTNPRLLNQLLFTGTNNIAQKFGIASQGSDYGSSVAAFAIDGDENTINHTGCNADNNWWQVKLPEPSLISRIVVKNRSSWRSRLSGSRVYVTTTSYTAGELSESDKVATLDSADIREISVFPKKSATYVIVKAADGNCLHMRELEVYGDVPATPYFNEHKDSYLIPSTSPIGFSVATIGAGDWQGDVLHFSITSDVPFAINTQGQLTVNNTLVANTSYAFDVRVSDGEHSITSAITIKTTTATAVDDAIASGSVSNITSQELLNAAIDEIDASAIAMLDAKVQLFNLNADGSAKDAGSLTAITWDPTHDASLFKPTIGKNVSVLKTNSVTNESYTVYKKDIAIIGDTDNARYMVMGSNPMRNAYRNAAAMNEQMHQFMENSLSWLTKRNDLKTQPFNVVIAHMRQSYYFPDEIATREWLDGHYTGQVSYNAADVCDGDQLSSCLDTSPDLLIISQYPSDNDDNTAIAQRVEQAIDAGTPVLYLHYDGGQTELGKALFPIFNVSYEWDNYWNKLSLSNYDVTQQLTTLPDRLVKIKTLLEHFKAADFAIDWAACDEGNCNAVPSLVTGFFEGASEVKSIMQNLDKAKINIFAESGYRLQKLLVLIGDHFRQNVVFPMDRITTNDTQFLESYFAEHAAYNYRLLNPAQPDMGNYSRSDFSHITPTNRTVNIISKRYFRSTGAYALPGKTFTVTRNDNSDLTVKVFIHSARDGATRIFENKGYVRPRITQSTHIEIKSGETLKLTSATGGPIHLEFSANDLPVEVMFSNIGEHPYWSSSADDARFAQALIDAKYDWAEVVTSGFEVHSTLTKMVKSVNDPKWGSAAAMAAAVTQYTSNYPHVLAGFKGPGIDVVPEIHDFAAEKGWTINSIDIVKHMNADQAACGYGCSGNPYDAYWSFDPIGHGDIHELGHSLQGRKRFIGWENHSMTNHYAYYTQSKYNAAVGSNAHTCQSLSFAQEFTLLQASIGQADPAAYMKTQLWDSADWNKQVSMYIQMLMSAEDNGAVKNGWHVRARLHILEREFYRADNNETDWLAKRDSLGFSNYTLEEAKAADNNDWLLIAISTVTARDYRDYLTMWGIPFSAKADAQVASYNYPIIPRKFYMSSATGYCEAKQNGDFLAKISLPVDGTQTWPTETDDDADGVWNALDNCPADANSDQQDTDNDGLGNVCDTTPTPTVDDTPEADVDSDKDGLPDAWENQYGLNPLDASDANADLDGDGMSNLEEFTNNSDPTKDTVNPVITLPEATTVLQAKGFKTKFAWDLLGKISAEDAHDGKLTATLTKVNEKAPKLRNNGNQLLLAAGKNRLTWTANDKAGNTINVEQMLYVLPRADFSIDQVGNEGETLTVTVSLNGVAPAYPVVIPFTLSGSAEQGADLDYILSTTVHEITINEPATGERPTGRLTVHLLDDGIAESTETLLFSMAETLTYATRGNKRQHRIKILANDLDDLPPKARIQVMQAGKKGKRVYQDNGIVTLTVKAKDPNKDALTYVWGDSLTDLKRDNNPATLEFDPTQLSVGRHEIAVTVSDGTHSIEIEKRIKVKAGNLTLPEASVDTDGDGKKDIDELGDENENGIADYLEDSQQGSHQLSTSDDNPIETTTGLLFELGDFAQHQDDPSSCQINEEDIKNYLNSFGKPVYQTDIAHTPILLLDYVINGLEEIGDSVQIIFSVPALPANAAIRKYSVDKGWQAFMVTDDGKNLIESLISTDGNCPNDESVVYQTGLLEGADCIRLTIEDGGVNDADDKVNGAIEDPVSVSTESSTTTTSTDTTPSGNDSSNGGGGVIPFYWFLFMGLLLLLRSYYINSKGNGSAR